MKPIGLALVGLGKIARDQHLPSLAAEPAFTLLATVSLAENLPDVPAYTDLDGALDAHPEVRAVALCTPPAVRAELAWRALRRGCHVLLEKPPCVQPKELDDLYALARQHGVSLFAAWHSRFAAAVATARDLLRDTRVSRVNVSWKEDHRVWHPGQAWLWQDAGFGVLDPGINALSILTHILPAPLVFESAELDCPLDSVMPAAARLQLRSGKAAAEMELDFLHAGEPCWDITVDTADTSLLLSHGGAQLRVNGQPVPVSEQREYAAVYTHFLQLIREGEQDADGSPLALAQQALLHGQRRALQTRVLTNEPEAAAPPATTMKDSLGC